MLVFAGAPLVVFLLIVGGLFAVDQGLARSAQTRTASDAGEAAARAEGFLELYAGSLRGFTEMFVPPRQVSDSAHFMRLVGLLNTHIDGFRGIWITGADGVVVLNSTLGDTGSRSTQRPESGAQIDVDTLSRLGIDSAVATARRLRVPRLSLAGELFTGERGFVMVSPVMTADSVVGLVLAGVLMDELLAVLNTRFSADRSRLSITAGSDMLVSVPGRRLTFSVDSSTSPVILPGGDQWVVHVAHPSTSWIVRLALWGFGLAALVVLVVGWLRERGQSKRIAERSQELEHLSSELLHANRAKSEFLANVSHELRTPLNAIVGFVDLLRDGVYGELAPRQIGPVDRIAASANHLRHLVDQVLDLAKITAGRLEVHTDVVDLRSFVLDIVGEMEALITERELALSLGVGATLPRLRTDPTHLRQILVNLVGNAIKYTNAGTISIRARLVGAQPASGSGNESGRSTPEKVWLHPLPSPAQGLWIALQVIDTGIGIAGSDLERIFDEFEQVGAGPRGESMQRGTGLGLSISRRLAKLLGGDIVVESTIGEGSTFTLWLPVDPADLKLADERRSPTRVKPVVEG